MIATKMCFDVDYQSICKDLYVFIYDSELKIWWMAVILFENIFNILPNSIREGAIKETKIKVEEDKWDYKENSVKLHGSVSVLISILYSASFDIPEWCPSLVTYLAKFRSGYGIVSTDVTKALSWFKK